jgi:hypothetical protein
MRERSETDLITYSANMDPVSAWEYYTDVD